MDREFQRQIFHIIIGIGAIFILYEFGRKALMVSDFLIVIIGLILINQRVRGKKIGIVEWFENKFEREGVLFPGWGSATYAIGVLIAVTILNQREEIGAVIAILAFGDSLSTIVGRESKNKLPWNNKKTVNGSIAFFVFGSIAGLVFVGVNSIIAAGILAIIESIDTQIDDNIMIPLLGSLLFLVI